MQAVNSASSRLAPAQITLITKIITNKTNKTMDKTKMTENLDLNVADKSTLVEQLPIANSFIGTLMKIHKKTQSEAESIFDRESIYYKQALNGDDRLKQCSGLSLYSVLLEIAVDDISIQPGQKSDAYLEARSIKGTVTAFLRITAYGELNMRIKSGQIVRMYNPVVIYEGDYFQPQTNERGELIVDYKPAIPRKSKKIIGAYVCIVLPGNGLDFKWLLEDDINRLQEYSVPKYGEKRGKANSLYSSANGGIDPGFLEAKTIKHAMRAYTKLRIGDSASFDDEMDGTDENSESGKPFAPTSQEQEPTNTNANTVTINDADTPY